MKKYANVVKMTIGLALVLVLAISSFNQPSLAVASADVVTYDSDYVTPQWWAEAHASAAAGAVSGGISGAVVGAMGAPGALVGGLVGAGAGMVGGYAGYAVTSMMGYEEPILLPQVNDKLFDH